MQPGQAGAVLRQAGVGPHQGAAAAGHRRAAGARRRGRETSTAGCSPTSTARSDGLFVNLELATDGFASLLTYPAQRRPRRPVPRRGGRCPTTRRRARGARAAAPACRRRCVTDLGATVPSTRRAVSVWGVTTLAERLGYARRRPPADHQLRRPRHVPRRQRRGLREPAHGRGHQRHADGAVPVGPRGVGPLPGRGRRRAPHAQRRVRPLPLGSDHRRRRRCSTATAASPGPQTDVWDHADLDEVRRECRAQIERAILWGFDVSHLDSHMGTLQLRPEFFDVYLELAVDFGLPLRLSGASSERLIGFPFRQLAAEEGVRVPRPLRERRQRGRQPGRPSRRCSSTCDPGVTEVYLHPAADTPELRAAGPRLGQPGRRPPPAGPRLRPAGPSRALGGQAHRLPRAARPPAQGLTLRACGRR